MIVADVLAVVFVHLGFLLAFTAYFLVSRGLFPRMTNDAERAARERPGLCLAAGLPTLLVLVLAGVVLAQAGIGPIKAAGALFLSATAGLSLAGVGAWASVLGSRITEADRSWRATLKGGAALVLTWMIPFLGWFLLLPVMLACGTGAMVVGRFRSAPAAVPNAPQPA